MVSSIGSSTNNLAKYLANFFTPFIHLEYVIKYYGIVRNIKEFVELICRKHRTYECMIVSFDSKSFFTNVLFERTIDINLVRNNEHNKTFR